jgi:hypothetical protein
MAGEEEEGVFPTWIVLTHAALYTGIELTNQLAGDLESWI